MPLMASRLGNVVDTVIVGNGPSALILSYILHGYIPIYVGGHVDNRLDGKLAQSPDLTRIAGNLHSYLSAETWSQALPINALLDSLIRPNGDTDIIANSCVQWRKESARAISHIVLGNAPHAGGQWADNPVKASWDIGTLSYAEQLNLPGYSFAQFWRDSRKDELPEMIRPTRNDVAEYLRAYPAAVGIVDAIRTAANVSKISRTNDGFYVEPFGITCKHVVLATGIFNINLVAPSLLSPLMALPPQQQGPILVIGSGFTAADIIISTPPDRKIVHLFNWDPVNRPSPLKACHGSAYPEYAWIYRQMKLAVERFKGLEQRKGSTGGISARVVPKSSTLYFGQRDWQGTYEGFPNSQILAVFASNAVPETGDSQGGIHQDNPASPSGVPRSATVEIGRLPPSSSKVTRTITSFQYAAGRRGSLSYLSPPLLQEVLLDPRSVTNGEPVGSAPQPGLPDPNLAESTQSSLISRLALRGKIDASMDVGNDDAAGLELAPDVFVIGSLTGDSLIRHAYGGCVAVAGAIASRQPASAGQSEHQELDRRK